MHKRVCRTYLLPVVLSLVGLAASVPGALAQPARLRSAIDGRHVAVLGGTLNPRARAEFDRGAVEPSFKVPGMSLVLQPLESQQAALERLLEEQQNPNSPNYHAWLTPEAYAERFGLAASDIAAMARWLEEQGFQVEYTARSRTWILFSGTAEQVRTTFHTEIHRFQVDGEAHYANATAPEIPAALEGLVAGIGGLDDFRPKPPVARQPGDEPRYTSGSTHTLAPGDLATIYNVSPLFRLGITGAGQKIAIVGQTDLDPADVRQFRQRFGLPAKEPQIIYVGGNPGFKQAEVVEANIDLQWAGAMAPDANLIFITAANVWTASDYAIDQNVAPTLSMSYGYCEQQITSNPAVWARAKRTIAQQANAQGITWIGASGDAGASDCDRGAATATVGLAVDLPAAFPEVTGMGGTEFYEGSGSYWKSPNDANGGSALSWIPEVAWNNTASRGSIWASGGGASTIFTKPSWQTGTGVPADGARDVPDIALVSSSGHDSFNIVVNGAMTAGHGGTSFASPIFAGMLALVNQYVVANGVQAKAGLGNINPILYQLAQSTPDIFHDVTEGDNIVPCQSGTPGCAGGRLGFAAGRGYDQVTGLGTIDAYNLAIGWPKTVQRTATTTSVSATPGSIAAGASTVLKATVAATGSASPTGSVTFTAGGSTLGTATLGGSGGSATASLTVAATQLASGANTVTAAYAGNSSFGASSATVVVTVIKSGASAVTATVTPNPVYQQTADANGYAWFYTVALKETAGVATTLTKYVWNGNDYTAYIADWFGSSAIAAGGTLSSNFRAKGLTPPVNITFGFEGKDVSSGQQWSQQITVPFNGPQSGATATAVTLTANPTAIASGGSAALTASVKASAGTVSPAGTVNFSVSGKALGTGTLSGSGGTAMAAFTVSGAQLATGANTITASYSGSSTFSPSIGSVTVTVSQSGGGRPAISAGGVQTAGAFGGYGSAAPGTWIEIYGANLAGSTRAWKDADFSGTRAPTSLDGVTVRVGGTAAAIAYVSPTQVNALVPAGLAAGTASVVVTTAAGSSDAYTLAIDSAAAGLLAPAAFVVNGKRYAGALFQDGVTFAMPAGAVAGVPSRAAKPGDVLTIYGVGFGPVSPDVPSGTMATQANGMITPVSFWVGGVPATVTYRGQAPNAVGLYQFNVVVPQTADDDAVSLTFQLGGVAGRQSLYLAVRR